MKITLTYKILRTKGNLKEGSILPNCCWKSQCLFSTCPEKMYQPCAKALKISQCVLESWQYSCLRQGHPGTPAWMTFSYSTLSVRKHFMKLSTEGIWAGRGGHTITICWPKWSWLWPGALFWTRILPAKAESWTDISFCSLDTFIRATWSAAHTRWNQSKRGLWAHSTIWDQDQRMKWMMRIQQSYESETYKPPNDDRWTGAMGGLGQSSPRPCPVAFGVRKN